MIWVQKKTKKQKKKKKKKRRGDKRRHTHHIGKSRVEAGGRRVGRGAGLCAGGGRNLVESRLVSRVGGPSCLLDGICVRIMCMYACTQRSHKVACVVRCSIVRRSLIRNQKHNGR